MPLGRIHRMPRTRRKYPRKHVYIPVECTSAGGTRRTHAWTLGGGGLFLGFSERIAEGTELAVRFQIPDQGIGIEFSEIEPEHREMILLQIGQRMAEKRRFPRVPLAVQVEQ